MPRTTYGKAIKTPRIGTTGMYDDEYENEYHDDLDDDFRDEYGDETPADTIPCSNCGTEVYEDSDHCPVCGEYLIGNSTSVFSSKSYSLNLAKSETNIYRGNSCSLRPAK